MVGHVTGYNGVYCDPWDTQARLQMIRRTITSDNDPSKRYSNEFKCKLDISSFGSLDWL